LSDKFSQVKDNYLSFIEKREVHLRHQIELAVLRNDKVLHPQLTHSGSTLKLAAASKGVRCNEFASKGSHSPVAKGRVSTF
jgi:hypothetical protein